MLPENLNNLSILALARLLGDEANNNPTQWKPKGYVSYPKVISKLESFLYKKAKDKLTNERYCRIMINVNMERDTGVIVVEITERQNYLPYWKDTRLAKRQRTDIVIWTGKHSLKST